jgi:hypothetical protein
MANKLAKTRPVDEPYAIFEGNGIKWHILKTYKTPASEKKIRLPVGSLQRTAMRPAHAEIWEMITL